MHNKKLQVFKAANVQAEKVRWFWEPYVPAGMITLLEGDPGVGKSWLLAALTASITTGKPFPGEAKRIPQNVLILSAEDSIQHTIVPRLAELGADLSKAFIIPEPFVFNRAGLDDLDTLIETFGAKCVFIDPIQTFIGTERDSNKMADVRAMMDPLNKIAAKHSCAIVIIRHLRKSPPGSAGVPSLYSGMGSIDFIAAARSTLQVTKGNNHTRVIQHIKANVGPTGENLTFSLKEGVFQWVKEKKSKPKTAKRQEIEANEREVCDLIVKLLSAGPVRSTVVLSEGFKQGFSFAKMHRYKLGRVEVSKKPDGLWYWTLKPGVKCTQTGPAEGPEGAIDD